jgi:hypothetical protein
VHTSYNQGLASNLTYFHPLVYFVAYSSSNPSSLIIIASFINPISSISQTLERFLALNNKHLLDQLPAKASLAIDTGFALRYCFLVVSSGGDLCLGFILTPRPAVHAPIAHIHTSYRQHLSSAAALPVEPILQYP